MAKVPTNLSIDADLKQQSIALFSELGMDLSTAVTIFLKQSIRVQGLPFVVSKDVPNADTIAAMNEYYMIKDHPERYKRYSSFKDALNEILSDA